MTSFYVQNSLNEQVQTQSFIQASPSVIEIPQTESYNPVYSNRQLTLGYMPIEANGTAIITEDPYVPIFTFDASIPTNLGIYELYIVNIENDAQSPMAMASITFCGVDQLVINNSLDNPASFIDYATNTTGTEVQLSIKLALGVPGTYTVNYCIRQIYIS